jgi:hypothetical protein
MRLRPIAIFIVCWALLSLALWTVLASAIYDPALRTVSQYADAERAQWLAWTVANAVPFVAAAVVVGLAAALARAARRGPPQHPAAVIPNQMPATPAAQRVPAPIQGETLTTAVAIKGPGASLSAIRRIYIRPAASLVHSGARFGLVMVRPGQQASDEIYFKKLDDRGTLMACVPLGAARFKCFIDYKGQSFERVRRALAHTRFSIITPRPQNDFRAWFALPNDRALHGRAMNQPR